LSFHRGGGWPVALRVVSVANGAILAEQILSRHRVGGTCRNPLDGWRFAGVQHEGHNKTYGYHYLHTLIICEIRRKGKRRIAKFCGFFRRLRRTKGVPAVPTPPSAGIRITRSPAACSPPPSSSASRGWFPWLRWVMCSAHKPPG